MYEPAPEDMFDKGKPKPPRFKTQIQPQLTLVEGKPAHFECQLVPVGDPHMHVEWYKDGQPIKTGQSLIQIFLFLKFIS